MQVTFTPIKFDNQRIAGLLMSSNDAKLRHKLHVTLGHALKRTGQHVRTQLTTLIRQESYLRPGIIRKGIRMSIKGDNYGELQAIIKVHSGQFSANRFRMYPNRVTTEKGRRSGSWTTPSVQIGPKEPFKLYGAEDETFSKAWIGKDRKGKKQMFHKRKGFGYRSIVKIVSLNYFASFSRIDAHAFDGAEDVFEKRLSHELGRLFGK